MNSRTKSLLSTLCVVGLAAAACGGSTSSEGTATDALPNRDPSTTSTTLEASQTTQQDADEAPPIPMPEPAAGDDILKPLFSGALVFAGGDEMPFVEVGPDFEGELGAGPALVGITEGDQLVVLPVDLAEEAPTGAVLFVTGDGDVQSAEDVTVDEMEGFFTATGELAMVDGPQKFALSLGFGNGSSSFELEGDEAIVRGDLGTGTYAQVQYLIETYPEVKTLILQDISGSVDDETNVQTARLVRNAGLNTHVRSDGEIASGGVDLFAAGVERTAEDGALLGIHSWCCGPNGESADEIPQDSDAHSEQLSYFTEMLGPVDGPAFYFRTLQASPFDGIDNMERSEMDLFNLITANDTLLPETDATRSVEEMAKGVEVDTAGELAAEIANRWSVGSETDSEVLAVITGEPSRAYIAFTGARDDSVSGEMLTVTMEPDDSAGWGVVSATSAVTCARGVDGELCR